MAGDRQLVSSGAVWEPVVGYSRAVRIGAWVSVADTTAARPGAGPVGGTDIAEQTREAIRRIAATLDEVGAGLRHVVRTRMFITDISRWEEIGRAHGEFFTGIRPAASMLDIDAIARSTRVLRVRPGLFDGPDPVDDDDAAPIIRPAAYLTLGTVAEFSRPAELSAVANALAPLFATVIVAAGPNPPACLAGLPPDVRPIGFVPSPGCWPTSI